mgnify:CR=1 FL=1
MFERTLEVSGSPHIALRECLGDLTVRVSEGGTVTLRTADQADVADLVQEGDTITLTVRDDCSLICPPQTTLTVQVVRGDLRVRGVRGPLTAETVHGDVLLRDTGPVTVCLLYTSPSPRD